MKPIVNVVLKPAAACLCMTLASVGSHAAAQGTTEGVQEFNPKAFPGYVVDDVVVPVPSEIFAVLDKLGEPNWRQELRKLKTPSTADRLRLSLVFGTVVAEGFVAVQAEDRQAVEDIGKEVIDLAKSLGLSKSVLPHAQSILDAADRSDWPSIRKEFDLTQKTVRDTMEQMKDSDLAQCVSLGGWLRGTASVTSVIGKNYSSDRAELLNQPLLVDHFLGSIGKMSESTKKHPILSDVNAGLTKIRKQMAASGDQFSLAAVQDIGNICNGLLTAINQAK